MSLLLLRLLGFVGVSFYGVPFTALVFSMPPPANTTAAEYCLRFNLRTI